MAGAPEDIGPIAGKLWDMEQRVAVQIAEKPLELREAAFTLAERAIRDMAGRMRVVPADKMDEFVKLQMEVIRQFVTEIDLGGTPRGGNA